MRRMPLKVLQRTVLPTASTPNTTGSVSSSLPFSFSVQVEPLHSCQPHQHQPHHYFLLASASACYLTPKIWKNSPRNPYQFFFRSCSNHPLMRRSTLAPFLVAAFLSTSPYAPRHSTTRAFSDAASTHSTSSSSRNHPPRKDGVHSDCPSYGCPLYPTEVHYNTDALKEILQRLRDLPAEQVNEHVLQGDPQSKGWNRRDAASLTLIGYKGGPLLQQVNQDRAVIVSPFYAASSDTTNAADGKENDHPNISRKHKDATTITATSSQSQSQLQEDDDDEQPRILMGVFDGHATRGELVSEYTATNLPPTVSEKLSHLPPYSKTGDNQKRQMLTVEALHETFVEMDQKAPADPSGGCTATVMLRQDNQIYVANAGDSRSFVVAYRPSTNKTYVMYISREDKPSLPDEKARVEAMGGQVYIPMRGTSRVVYQDPITRAPSGLAMSRSIGDWAAGKLGVIPDPIVDVLEISDLVQAVLKNETEHCYVMDENGEMDTGACSDRADGTPLDDVYIFAVAATDGMMDYLAAEEIAKVLAKSLFDKGASHPISACELLIFSAANGWQQDKQGRYRDDIAIAVSTMRQPPPEEPTEEDSPAKSR